MAIAPSPTAVATRFPELAEEAAAAVHADNALLGGPVALYRCHHPGLVQPGVGPVQVRGLHQLPGLRRTVRRHSTSTSSHPARTTGRSGGQPSGRDGAQKSHSSPRARRSGTAARAPIPSEQEHSPHPFGVRGCTRRIMLRCESLTVHVGALAVSLPPRMSSMLAGGRGPHIIRPASSGWDGAPGEPDGECRPGRGPAGWDIHPRWRTPAAPGPARATSAARRPCCGRRMPSARTRHRRLVGHGLARIAATG